MSNELTTINDSPLQAIRTTRVAMANNPAVMSALDSVEKAVFLSSTAKTFLEYNVNELALELRKSLSLIFRDTGFRPTGEAETNYLVIRVCEIVKRYFPTLTLKDFRMAFEMCITGELDEYLPKGRDGQADRSHYQQFNADYVCKVLGAYKSRRAWILKKANDATPKKEGETDPEEIKFYRLMAKQDLIKCYESFVETGRLEMTPIGEKIYYDLLAGVGLAEKVEVTAAEQKEIFERTINALARNGMRGDVDRLKASGIEADELQNGAFTLARKKALKETFERMMENGINIREFIKVE